MIRRRSSCTTYDTPAYPAERLCYTLVCLFLEEAANTTKDPGDRITEALVLSLLGVGRLSARLLRAPILAADCVEVLRQQCVQAISTILGHSLSVVDGVLICILITLRTGASEVVQSPLLPDGVAEGVHTACGRGSTKRAGSLQSIKDRAGI